MPAFLKNDDPKEKRERVWPFAGKYAAQLDLGHAPRNFSLAIHRLDPDCAYGNYHTDFREYFIEFDDVYIRHYRHCGNMATTGETFIGYSLGLVQSATAGDMIKVITNRTLIRIC